ncbi:MAG: hypothetical protein GX633_08965 [Clostridiales bacterium]|nr:hypothetical protein [Clostridiales bacterium]
MANSIDEMLDILYNMVEEAWSIPLGRDKCVLKREDALNIIDEIRGNLPGEIKRAREIVENRNEIVAAARRDADSMKLQSEEKARAILNKSEIVNMAKEKAAEIERISETRAKELKSAASTYCDDILKETEDSVTETLEQIRSLRAQFRKATSNPGKQ